MRARAGVLFVCLGNICRSPLAKAVFAEHARRAGVIELLTIDSCGTGGWHAGEGADPRTIAAAASRSIPLEHVARQFDAAKDPERFQWIIAMDRSNVAALTRMGLSPGRASLLRSFGGEGEAEVPDPYYGGPEGFDRVYEMIDAACPGLLRAVLADVAGGAV